MDMSAAAGAVCTAGFPLPLWCKDNQIYNAEGLNSLRDQNWFCRLVVGQNQGHTAERSQQRPALCHRWIVSADKRCSQKVSKTHQILQGPTELKQSSRNNTCTPIAMNDPWRHMDLAGGTVDLSPCLFQWPCLSVYEIHIGYWSLSPSLSRENPQLMALVWCQRNTENTQKRTQP